MHAWCVYHPRDYVHMYRRRDKSIDFHSKHIAQTKGLVKHMSNTYEGTTQSEKVTNLDEKSV
jgi:hypothetical protein